MGAVVDSQLHALRFLPLLVFEWVLVVDLASCADQTEVARNLRGPPLTQTLPDARLVRSAIEHITEELGSHLVWIRAFIGGHDPSSGGEGVWCNWTGLSETR